jgi:hypothetical protein
MKVDLHETHDRFKHFVSQDFSIDECCQDLVNQKPFDHNPFYIFCHSRTHDDGVTKRLIWQSRLTKPKAQTNSMLFKAYPGTDIIKVIWIIPSRELWPEYMPGKVNENKMIWECIQDFINTPEKLEKREEDDLPDEKIREIYASLSRKPKIYVPV